MCMNELRINMGFGFPLGFGLRLSPCYRSITGFIISCSKIGQKPAKTKFLQNICANVKMTNN